MTHLLAISGLHIGLIYGIILGLVRWLGRLSNRFLEFPRFYGINHLISLTGIWLYLLLIGMPTPAFRTVCMLSLLVAGRLLGQVHHLLYALFATAFFLFSLIQQLFTKSHLSSHSLPFCLYYGSGLFILSLTKIMYSGNGYLNTE